MKTLLKLTLVTLTISLSLPILAEDAAKRFEKSEFEHDGSQPVRVLTGIGTIAVSGIALEKIHKAENKTWEKILPNETSELDNALKLEKEADKLHSKKTITHARVEAAYNRALAKSNPKLKLLNQLKADLTTAKSEMEKSKALLKEATKKIETAETALAEAKKVIVTGSHSKINGYAQKLNKLKLARRVASTLAIAAFTDFSFRFGVAAFTDQEYPTGILPEYEAIEIIYNNARRSETNKPAVSNNTKQPISKSKNF